MQPNPPQLPHMNHFSLLSRPPSQAQVDPYAQTRPRSEAPCNPPEYAHKFHTEGITLLPPVSSTPVGPAHHPPYVTDGSDAYAYGSHDGGEKGEKAVPPIGYEYQEPQGDTIQFQSQQRGKMAGLKRFFNGNGPNMKGDGVQVRSPGMKALRMIIWCMAIGFLVSATFVSGVMTGRRMECAPYYGHQSGDSYGYYGNAYDTSNNNDDTIDMYDPLDLDKLRQGLGEASTLSSDSSGTIASSVTSATGATNTASGSTSIATSSMSSSVTSPASVSIRIE